jgi:hypothetical protein
MIGVLLLRQNARQMDLLKRFGVFPKTERGDEMPTSG